MIRATNLLQGNHPFYFGNIWFLLTLWTQICEVFEHFKVFGNSQIFIYSYWFFFNYIVLKFLKFQSFSFRAMGDLIWKLISYFRGFGEFIGNVGSMCMCLSALVQENYYGISINIVEYIWDISLILYFFTFSIVCIHLFKTNCAVATQLMPCIYAVLVWYDAQS